MGNYEIERMQEYEDQCHEEYEHYLDNLEAKMKEKRENPFEVDTKEWKDKMDTLEAESDGPYVFPKKGNTTVRLLLSPERDATDFWQPVITVYDNKARTRHMIPVLVEDEVKLLVTAKTVLEGMLNLLYNGYDLLSENAVGVIISRTGDGLGTKYAVMPTPKPIPVAYDGIEWEGALLEAAQEFENIDREEAESVEVDDEIPF